MVKSLTIKHLAIGYLCIGFAISLYQNLSGELSAFAWTGSIKGTALLLFWWFIVPTFIWPWDLFWGVFHRLF
jgi:hypothetical protein